MSRPGYDQWHPRFKHLPSQAPVPTTWKKQLPYAKPHFLHLILENHPQNCNASGDLPHSVRPTKKFIRQDPKYFFQQQPI